MPRGKDPSTLGVLVYLPLVLLGVRTRKQGGVERQELPFMLFFGTKERAGQQESTAASRERSRVVKHNHWRLPC